MHALALCVMAAASCSGLSLLLLQRRKQAAQHDYEAPPVYDSVRQPAPDLLYLTNQKRRFNVHACLHTLPLGSS